MSTQNALKLLFELRAVLDRIGESDVTLHETVVHDVDRAVRLTNACVEELTEEAPEGGEGEEEDDD